MDSPNYTHSFINVPHYNANDPASNLLVVLTNVDIETLDYEHVFQYDSAKHLDIHFMSEFGSALMKLNVNNLWSWQPINELKLIQTLYTNKERSTKNQLLTDKYGLDKSHLYIDEKLLNLNLLEKPISRIFDIASLLKVEMVKTASVQYRDDEATLELLAKQNIDRAAVLKRFISVYKDANAAERLSVSPDQ